MSDEHGSDFVDELMEFLLRNYYSMMIKRVKRFFPNKFDAEDIVTETIIVLLENKSAVAAHEAPIKWLQTTLTHRVKQNSIIASELSEKDAKTFNDVFVLKRDREQVAAEYGISPEALRQRARRVEMKVRLIVSKLLG